MASMRDKVCVVTGGAKGIGRAIAVNFASRGARAVVVADIDHDAAAETVRLVEAAGAAGSVKMTDVGEAEQVTELMEYAATTYGSLDALVNNAGVHEMYWAEQTTVDTLPVEVFDRIMRINLRSVFLATQAAVPFLRQSTNDPCIVNAASTGSFTAYPAAGAYSSSKAAILQFTKVSAVDLAPDIRVNAYAPGTIDTDMVSRLLDRAQNREEIEATMTATHLVPRMGRPEDVAHVVNFLASSEAAFVTGATYLVDGGSLAWRGSR